MADVTLPPGVQALRDASARRVQDVRHVQFPRIGECASAADLAAAEEELHASLARITSLVQQVADEVEEGETTEQRAALQAAAAHDAAALEADARRALLAAHRASQARQEVAARAALRLDEPRARSGAPEDRTRNASEQVTHALQRTVALMSTELEKSGYSSQLLEESSEMLGQVSDRYESFNDLLRNSVSLIRQMERAELIDVGLLAGSIAFFAGCVLYILYVRVISRGLWAVGAAWKLTGLLPRGSVATPIATTASLGASVAMHSAPPRLSRKRPHDAMDDVLASVTDVPRKQTTEADAPVSGVSWAPTAASVEPSSETSSAAASSATASDADRLALSASSAEGTRVAGGKLESAAPDVSAAAPEDTDVALDAEAVEVPDGESPEDEASEAGAPEAEAPEAEAPEAEASEAGAPEAEAPEAEAPEAEAATAEAPEAEAPEAEAATAEAPEAEAPAAEASEAETPDAEAPTDTTDDPSAWRWDNEL